MFTLIISFMKTYQSFYLFAVVIILLSCESNSKKKSSLLANDAPNGMIWVAQKTFMMGARSDDKMAMSREKPSHSVTVSGFYIDETEVTNAQFRKFINETKYLTVAERPIDWNEMKKQLPAGTQKPHDSLLKPGSLIFNKNLKAVASMDNYYQWWTWKTGANWKQPYGEGTNIDRKDNFPVVHVSYEDALAYCKWANRRLPTEAEWESAALGTKTSSIFTWGNDVSKLNEMANTWQGVFPVKNQSMDGFEYISPIKSFPANSIGIYDMTGNVWELTSDWFHINYYQQIVGKKLVNPKGATESYNPQNPYQKEKVMKGGSFLCHESYCASFRISARMASAMDTGSDHLGFRTVATQKMLKN